MNRSVFSLIFDYRGRISNKEFLYGIMVLLFTASLLCSYELLGNSKIFDSFRLGINMRFWYQTNYVIYMFLPSAPLSAVIFYSSFVLAVKRLRSRGSGIIPGLIIGFLIFLGLKSIVIYAGNRYYREGWILIPFVPGLICIIILSLKNSYDMENNKFSEMLYSFSWYGEMSDKDYIAHLTKIYIWSVCSAAVYVGLLFIIAKTADNKYEAIDTYGPFLSICISIILLIMSLLYFNISMQRLRDIGFKGRWIPILLVLYACSLVITYFIFKTKLIIILIPIFITFVLYSVIWISQFLLMVLPSNFRERITESKERENYEVSGEELI